MTTVSCTSLAQPEFEQSIRPWTLTFRDPADESAFSAKFTASLTLPGLLRVSTYLAILYCIFFRIYSLYCLSVGGIKPTGTFAEEFSALLFILVALGIAIVCRVLKRLESTRGLLLYTCFPLIAVYSTFFTLREPYFDLTSAFVLMVTPCSATVFINSWHVVAVGNVLVSLGSVAMFLYYFNSTATSWQIFTCVFSSLFCVNLSTVFYYVYERGFRKLHFMEKEVQLGMLRWRTVLNYMPVGIMIVDSRREAMHINHELQSYFTLPDGRTHLPGSDLNIPAEAPSQTEPRPDSSSCIFESMVDRNNRGFNLRQLLNQTGDEDQCYQMIYEGGCAQADNSGSSSPAPQRVFEVKTKSLPEAWPEGYRIVLVKDQTVYEQLLKEKTLEKYQRMLLSSISHEIRNPLNAIECYNSLIAESKVSDEIRALCAKSSGAVQRIDLTLASACEVMMSENGDSVLTTQKFELLPAFQSIVDILRPSVEGKPVKLETQVESTVPQSVCSDPKKYKTILFHLITNAIKYTATGEVKVTLSYDEASRTLKTEVKDTGVGISPRRMASLFELYGNVEGANPYNPQGMGLGLSLSKKLARNLGGDLVAQSEVGKGSMFAFTVQNWGSDAPAGKSSIRPQELSYLLGSKAAESAVDDEIPPEGASVPQDTSNAMIPSETSIAHFVNDLKTTVPRSISYICEKTKKQRPAGPSLFSAPPEALIVDDEPTNRLVLRSYLKGLNFVCEEAENGLMAIAKVEERAKDTSGRNMYGLILMDINMPQMDGTTATQVLRAGFKRDGLPQVPILAVTAANIQNRLDAQKLLEVGFTDILIKPVTKSGFLDAVRKYVRC